MSNIIRPAANRHLNDLLHNRRGSGWEFSSGDPEFWKYSDKLLVPGGKLLDIGTGPGSSSIYFALNGMDVTGIDANPDSIWLVNAMSAELKDSLPDFKMKAIESNVIEQPLPVGEFDTIIIDYMIHLPSMEAAQIMLDKALESLKSGGHLYVRMAGKHSDEYQSMLNSGEYSFVWGPTEIEDDGNVIWHYCGCSGQSEYEPTLYLDPLDLHTYFAGKGVKLVHSQTIPTNDKMNIMFGEDFNPEQYVETGGMVTAIVQKN